MLLVRGTKKFRGRISGSIPAADGDQSTNLLGDWFATALSWRPQVALLVNRRTMLPVFMPLAPTATLMARIPEAIAEVLREHGLPDHVIANELDAVADVRALWAVSAAASALDASTPLAGDLPTGPADHGSPMRFDGLTLDLQRGS